jgi:cytochrome c peroxidase
MASGSWLLVAAALCAAACSRPSGVVDAKAVAASALGEMLFSDPRLSADGRVACATCHQPERGFADGRPQAIGFAGQRGTRNTPSLLDVGRQRSLFWDGRRAALEDQALDPLLNEREHGLRDEAELLARLRGDGRYAGLFAAAFGVPVGQATARQVGEALAAYERTLVSVPAPVDRFLDGDRGALSEAARRGWVIFDQAAHCTRCHPATARPGEPALFTDHGFHALGVGLRRIERALPQLTQRLVALRAAGRPLGREVLLDADLAELGRFAVTLDPRDLGAFKTPGLRNVARTAPYMHDGSVATLADAVDLEVYQRGATDARPLILTPAERADLIVFLEALTSRARS